MKLFYWEVRNYAGKWCPQSSPVAPEIKDIAIVKPETSRVKVRAFQEIPPDHHRLTLGQLWNVYSPDGLLDATQFTS